MESNTEDEEYVLRQSKMDQYLKLEYRHFHQKHESSDQVRSQYFSNLTCTQLIKLQHIYQMDLDLFDYNIEPFKALCVREK